MYTALDSRCQQIRLLRVIPKNQNNVQIRCEIVGAQLQGSMPKYAALSYVWGDAADTEEIVVDGQPFQATRSLNSALQQFRASYTRNGCNSLLLWADAVCINQQDLAERGQQVSMMGLIYAKATLVISWLGSSTELTALGFVLIKSCSRRIQEVRRKRGAYPTSDVFMEIAHLEFLSENTAFYENNTELSSGNKAWNAIDELNRHAYWTQVWIVQEVVLACRPDTNIIFCGSQSMTFQQLQDFHIFTQTLLAQPPDKPSFFDQGVWRWVVTHRYLFSNFIVLVQTLRENRIRGDYRFVSMISKQCRSADPRDVVFGLSGLLGGEIVPDYTKKIVDVFRECVVAALRNGTYDNLFFTAGLIREGRDISVFPSWVPRFHTLGEDIHYAISARSSSICWTKDINCPEAPQILDERIMRINSVRLDRYACDTHVPDQKELARQFWWLCLEFLHQYGDKYPRDDGMRALEDLFDALIKGLDTRGDPLRAALSSTNCIETFAFRLMLQAAVPDANDEAAVKKWQSYGYTSLEEAKTALEDAFVGPQAPEMPVAYSDSFKCMHPMMGCILRWIHRPLFRTERGHMGLAPPAVGEGDIVCLLEGFSLPCLLRKHGQGHYVLVGTCYINGYSSGEVLAFLREGDVSLEPFHLL
ncbi:hypothetical protein PG990_002892 [Apiospora arundinis]